MMNSANSMGSLADKASYVEIDVSINVDSQADIGNSTDASSSVDASSYAKLLFVYGFCPILPLKKALFLSLLLTEHAKFTLVAVGVFVPIKVNLLLELKND